MKNILKYLASLFVVASTFVACDTDVEHDIAVVDAPAFVSSIPATGTVSVKSGEITLQIQYDKNVFFASEDLDKLSFMGGQLVSADVLGSSNTLTVKVNVPTRETVCTLTIPAGVVTGPNKMPAPEVSFSFTTIALDKTPVAATSAKAVKLYNYLLENFEQKTLSAMMADVAWNTDMSERVYQWTGKYPAINCFDYVHLASSVAGVNWINYGDITPVKNWSDNGGIVAAMWHWNVPKKALSEDPGATINPNEDYAFYKEDTEFDAANATVEGTWENKVFTQDLASVAAYLKLLKDADIPVLWRPLHEAAGGWFWWGKDAASFKNLWITMFNYFKEQELDNLIWVWTTEGTDADWYPGDQYVDIVGRDIYTKETADCVSEFTSIAGNYGNKMVALSECGSVGLISEQWNSGARWSWFMPWYDGEEDGAPIVHADEAWWKDAMGQSFVIDRDQVPSMQ